MLQVVVSGGEIQVVDVPPPALGPRAVLVRTSHSLVSAGTESAAVGKGGRRESLLLRAIRNPALVAKVIDRAKSHGVRSTAELVRARVTSDQPIGYSCAGTVVAVGDGVDRLRVGDRVACCGAGYANHAAFNALPQNLVAPLPDAVSFEEAAFGTLGAIALQGVRRCAPALGDRVAVLGLGLIGQLTCQLLRAAGAVVIGADVRADRVRRARDLGAPDAFSTAELDFARGVKDRTDGRGADAVIVTAAAADPGLLNTACEACRRKGRVVLVGDVPIRIARDRIYAKEIDFLISTSYGPGRYDPEYEEKGHDYPFAYVRWTENRNLEEVLRLIAAGSLDVRPLIDARYPVSEAPAAYRGLAEEPRPIGVLLEYPEAAARPERARLEASPRRAARPGRGAGYGVGVVGFGSYFRGVLLPLLKRHEGFRLVSVCARSGLKVRHAVEKDGFERGTTNYRELLDDPGVDVVYVATRHDLHYPVARAALLAGKAVFVEKPMTLTASDGRELAALAAEKGLLLTVGFNRRFSPHAARLKDLLRPLAGPKSMLYRVNAGPLPDGHWLADPAEGGGRLLGEGVHFFDFLAFLAGAEPVRVASLSPPGRGRNEAIVSLQFADGSVGAVVYAGSGSPALGKERVEVFCAGSSFVIDDYQRLLVYDGPGEGHVTRAVEKGQREQLENLYAALRGEADLGVTGEDGVRATRCAEQALASAQGA
ncbi:MAG TPA: bi-domain-containing oxidoreductase [Vicinamibacteria bacterium]|nr:bi-domain-containing oxidoreductase [Vicinamibacteria bacterium]